MSRVVIDLDSFTLAEVEEFEEHAGVTLAELSAGVPSKAISVLVWLTNRRNDPNYTLDKARTTRMSEIEWSDGNPTEGDS